MGIRARDWLKAVNEKVALIADNLSTSDINPSLYIGNGNTAKAYKYFSETRNQWVYTIGYYADGTGQYKTDDFASFEALIEGMAALASGDIGLWGVRQAIIMPPKPSRRNISIIVTAEQLAAVTAEARRRDIDLSRLIHLALSQQVEGYDAAAIPRRGTYPRNPSS